MPGNSNSKPARKHSRAGLTGGVRENLYEVTGYLTEESRERLGLYLDGVYAYTQDPLVAKLNPQVGIRPIEVRWEPGLADGPTSARLVVVDYDPDTDTLYAPVFWDSKQGRFLQGPGERPLDSERPDLFQFHQVNVWAIVQRVLDLFQHPEALGRPVPWGVDGNRLILVPHAGSGKNAFYDRHSKSLQFYYYGAPDGPHYTCLSHDIIAHEAGHACLDGIRPYYYTFSSVQTAAFHEFVADLTAILAALQYREIREATGGETEGHLERENVVASLAEEFGEDVTGVRKLRDANNEATMESIQGNDSPHDCSQVLTGAMFEILVGLARLYREEVPRASVLQALYWGARRLVRLAWQPLDLCPPVDIQFIDYAQAVVRHFEYYEPLDSPRREAYCRLVRDTFHKRGLCTEPALSCAAGKCLLDARDEPRLPVYHPVDEIARSRTAAYCFLNDNRAGLRIPINQDLVVDVVEARKYGRQAHRLPHQIVVQYVWREEVPLAGQDFGPLRDQNAELLCGGTLVFDERGNLLSWMRKPGTQVQEDALKGAARLEQLRQHVARQVAHGAVGLHGDGPFEALGVWTPPVVAALSEGAWRLEIRPALRDVLDREPQPGAEGEQAAEGREREWRAEEWTNNF